MQRPVKPLRYSEINRSKIPIAVCFTFLLSALGGVSIGILLSSKVSPETSPEEESKNIPSAIEDKIKKIVNTPNKTTTEKKKSKNVEKPQKIAIQSKSEISKSKKYSGKKVILRQYGFDEIALAKLADKYPNPSYMDLSHGEFGGDSLKRIKNMTDLTYLDLSNLQDFGNGYSHLVGLTNLEELDLSHITERSYNRRIKSKRIDWEFLGSFPHLEILNLTDTLISDNDLRVLRNLRNLKSLNISKTSITDDGLVHLKDLTNLKILDLSKCIRIVGNGFQHLTNLSKLESLEVHGSYRMNLTDLSYFSAFINLKKLDLEGCSRIKRSGFEPLKSLRNLKYLNLDGTKIGSQGLPHLAELINLEYLDLRFVDDISDSGLRSLHGLKNLKKLILPPGTGDPDYKITYEGGMKPLREALPNCKITRTW